METTESKQALRLSLRDIMSQPALIMIFVSILILFPFYISVPAAVLAVSLIFWKYRRRLGKIALGTGWFGAGAIFSFMIAFANRNQYGIWAAIGFILVWTFFRIYRNFVTPDLLIKMLNIIGLGSIGTSLYAIYQYLVFIASHGFPLDYIVRDPNPKHRAMSTLFNANYYGLFCIFALLIGAYLFVKAGTKKAKVWYGLSMVLNVVGILLTASRMALPALVVGTITFVFFINRRLVLWLGGIGLAGACLVFFFPELLARFTSASFSHSLEEREMIWRAAWGIFTDYPLTGRGPMSYFSFFYLYGGKGQPHAHQLFLEFLSSYGLYGTAIYLIGTVRYFRERVALWFKPEVQAEIGLVTAMIVTVLVHGLSDVAVMWLQTGYIFLFIVTCPVAVWEALASYRSEDGYLKIKA